MRLPRKRGGRSRDFLARDVQVCDHVVVKSVVKCGQIDLAHPCKLLKGLAPQVGLEPTTLRLTGGKSVVSRALPALLPVAGSFV